MSAPTRTSLVMLTTPRSGSSWLASLCRSTGVMGLCREWLTSLVHPASPHKIPVPPTGGDRRAEFRAALARVAGTSNGVDSVKIISSIWAALPATLAPWGFGDGTSDAWIGELFPRPAILVLRRRDRIGQAISWWRAVQTGRFARFTRDAADEGMPPYDFPSLLVALSEMNAFAAQLDRAADACASIPGSARMDVVYEDSLHDPAAVVRGFASIAGLTIDPTQQLATDLAVQRDAATAAVRERFERELAASGTMIPTTSHEQPSSVGGVRA